MGRQRRPKEVPQRQVFHVKRRRLSEPAPVIALVALDAALDRLVPEDMPPPTEGMKQRHGGLRLPDLGPRSGDYDDSRHASPSRIAAKAAATSASECAAVVVMRSRAVPSGTDGGRIACMWTSRARSSRARRTARRGS